jgi:hypothetical protein
MSASRRAEARRALSEEVIRHCVARYGRRLQALVLTGSLARGEATFVRDDGGYRLLGDAEFLAIAGRRGEIPAREEVKSLVAAITQGLAHRGLHCQVSISTVPPRFLRRLKPHIFAYELRECGQVVWGDVDVLSLIPPFAASEIPLEDAWRLLANRLVEQLTTLDALVGPEPALSQAAHYTTVKLVLDMATSLTVFTGLYRPTYRARAEALASRAALAHPADWPFSPRAFAADVARCTRWKLNGTSLERPAPIEFLHRALTHAQQLWRWELARLTGLSQQAGDRTLLEAWMAHQPLRERLRGWLYVLRAEGLARPSTWIPCAARTLWWSPRYGLYAAATGLLFSITDAATQGRSLESRAPTLPALRRYLPLPPRRPNDPSEPEWRRLAADIAWNYERFLVPTRS